MEMNNLIVTQQGQIYNIYTPNNIWIAQIYMGNDNNFLLDAKCLEVITKLLAKRWRVAPLKK